MTNPPENGARQDVDGKPCIYFDGYWIRYYPPPEESLDARKRLIDSLTRRAFRHTESGINTPGERLDQARLAYQRESDPARRRVNAAMLAGALFNRATDLFTAIVELEHKGVHVSRENELMRQCAGCFREALELGRQVKHYSGQEGIDELWGEPFKAFTQPVARLFESRYRKIAQTMRDIDRVAGRLVACFETEPGFQGVGQRVKQLATSARLQVETMKSDPAFFSIWPAFVAAREALESFRPAAAAAAESLPPQRIEQGVNLIKAGTALITYLSEARVPMPRSMQEVLRQCDTFEQEKKDRQPDQNHHREIPDSETDRSGGDQLGLSR